MTYTQRISAGTWLKLYAYLVEFPKIHTGNEDKTRQFVEAVVQPPFCSPFSTLCD